MSLTPLPTEDALAPKIASGELIVAYASHDECNVCKVIKPQVAELLAERKIEGLYLNTKTLPETAGQQLVFAVPTIIVYADGREIHRLGRHFSMGELDRFLGRVQDALAG